MVSVPSFSHNFQRIMLYVQIIFRGCRWFSQRISLTTFSETSSSNHVFSIHKARTRYLIWKIWA
jgi:hypothetical protein